MFAVAEVVRYEEAVLRALLHELQALGPSGDDLVEGEHCGLAALHAAVKHRAVNQEALVVALHLVRSLRLVAVAFTYHLVLQSAGQGHHALFPGVLGEVLLAFGLRLLALFGHGGVGFLFLLTEKFLYDCLRLAVFHLRLCARQHVLYGRGEVVDVQARSPHLHQLASDAETQSVT